MFCFLLVSKMAAINRVFKDRAWFAMVDHGVKLVAHFQNVGQKLHFLQLWSLDVILSSRFRENYLTF